MFIVPKLINDRIEKKYDHIHALMKAHARSKTQTHTHTPHTNGDDLEKKKRNENKMTAKKKYHKVHSFVSFNQIANKTTTEKKTLYFK